MGFINQHSHHSHHVLGAPHCIRTTLLHHLKEFRPKQAIWTVERFCRRTPAEVLKAGGACGDVPSVSFRCWFRMVFPKIMGRSWENHGFSSFS